MPTRKNQSDRRSDVQKEPTGRVVVVGYDFKDAAIDELLELAVRMIERALTNPRFLKLIALGLKFAG
jgi:hypothetical protein